MQLKSKIFGLSSTKNLLIALNFALLGFSGNALATTADCCTAGVVVHNPSLPITTIGNTFLNPYYNSYWSQYHTIIDIPLPGGGVMELWLQNVHHYGFSDVITFFSGGNQNETFNSQLAATVVVGGNSFDLQMSGPTATTIFAKAETDVTGSWDVAMSSLDLAGTIPSVVPGLGGAPVKIRLDHDHATTGHTSVSSTTNGDYVVDSFFDVWIDLSIDNGNSWIAASNASHVVLSTCIPEPEQWLMLMLGLPLLTFAAKRKV